MPITNTLLLLAMAAAPVLLSQSAPVQPAEPKPAAMKPISELSQLKLEVFQLRLEKVVLQVQILQAVERAANEGLNAHILSECIALGGKAIDDCDMDFTAKPYRMALRPPPPAEPKPEPRP